MFIWFKMNLWAERNKETQQSSLCLDENDILHCTSYFCHVLNILFVMLADFLSANNSTTLSPPHFFLQLVLRNVLPLLANLTSPLCISCTVLLNEMDSSYMLNGQWRIFIWGVKVTSQELRLFFFGFTLLLWWYSVRFLH